MARSAGNEGFRIVGIEGIPKGGLINAFLVQEPLFQKVVQTASSTIRAARLALDHKLVTDAIPDPKTRLLALVFYASQAVLHNRRNKGDDPQIDVFTEYGFPPDLQEAAEKETRMIRSLGQWRTFIDVTSAYRAKIFEQQQIEVERLEAERRFQRAQQFQTRLQETREREFQELKLRNASAAAESLVFPDAKQDQRERRIRLINLRRTPQGTAMSTEEIAQALNVSVPTIIKDQRAIDSRYPGAIPPRHQGHGFGPRQLTVTHRDAIIETIARLEEEHGPWKYRCVTYEMVGAELGMTPIAVKNLVLGDLNLPHQDRGTIHSTIIRDIQELKAEGNSNEQIIAHFGTFGISERQVRMAMGENL